MTKFGISAYKNRKTNKVYSNLSGTWKEEIGIFSDYALQALRTMRKRKLDSLLMQTSLNSIQTSYLNTMNNIDKAATPTDKVEIVNEAKSSINFDKEQAKQTLSQFIDFFKDVDFEPNYRFVNTFSILSKSSINEAKSYVSNYFELCGNEDKSKVISDKLDSPEFNTLAFSLAKFPLTKTINNRFKVYYGAQGTGKTTKAMEESSDVVMVCHSAMLPQDLMEDFKFDKDGHPQFTPSVLQQAMVNGTKITLDEINLLPFESLRFLQSLLDDKPQITWKGHEVNIKDGFEIIGTMNLEINGQVYGLPSPLVDRAASLKKFTLTAEDLVNAID